MGVLTRLLAPLDMNPGGPQPSNVAVHSNAPVIIDGVFYLQRTPEAQALAVAAVFRARQMNADTVASLPLRTSPTTLVPAPNRDQTTQEFVAETILSLEDSGDAYWQVDSSGNMTVLPHGDMSVTWNPARTRRVYTYRGSVLRAWGLNPPLVVLSINRTAAAETGFGPMESDRIQGLIAEQKYSQELFENSGNPSGTLTVPGDLNGPEATALLDQWVAARKVRGPAVASGGAEWKPMAFSPSDSEWVGTHLAGVGDAATLFGIPSTLLNYNQPGSSLTYENVADVYQAYWRQTLHPTYAARIEAAWAGVIGAPVAFDPEQLFLAAMGVRARSAGELIRDGFDPADVLDVVGIRTMRHTGAVPVSVYPEE